MNFVTKSCIFFALIILVMQWDSKKDEKGRGILGRLEAGALDANDKTGFKLIAILLALAGVSYLIFE